MFKSARIKLTAWYLAIIMVILFVFSDFVYFGITNSAKRALVIHNSRVERELRGFRGQSAVPPRFQEPINEETIENLKQNLLIMLSIINFSVLGLAGILGYFLAGKTLAPIEQMVEKQKRFVSDAAHELRTPLTAMKTELEVTNRNKKLTIKEAKNALKSAVEDVDKLTALTNYLLKESKYNELKGDEKFEVFDLSSAVKEAQKKIEPKAKEKNIKIEAELEKIKLRGMQNRLTELITIILDNAIKYSDKDTKISVRTKALKNKTQIVISDQGIGIAEKDLPYIFDRFFRADISRTKNIEEGYGIGLALAKDITIEHKGTIEVKSEINKGTTFIVTLPNKS